MKQINRTTFCQIVAASTDDAAKSAWGRAKLASQLRHVAVAQGRRGAARRLAVLKRDAIRHVLHLKPKSVRLGLDNEYQVGLLSVHWPGHGKLHLPSNTDLITSLDEAAMAS
jgi:hypothetical protein